MQCIQVFITDDNNILEDLESFQLNLTALESFVIVPRGVVIYISEDPDDSEWIYLTSLQLIIALCQ